MTLQIKRINSVEELPKFKLRPSDELECLAGGMTGEEAIRYGVEDSQECYLMTYKGDIVGIWGFRSSTFLGEVAYAWFLSTEHGSKYPYKFARESVRIVNYMLQSYPFVKALVHVDYHLAIEWLGWLKFEIEKTEGDFHLMSRGR